MKIDEQRSYSRQAILQLAGDLDSLDEGGRT